MMTMKEIIEELNEALAPLEFPEPVAHVYNPHIYAKERVEEYLDKFAQAPKEVVLVGMNPGPWGMGQTGVPFGAVPHVRDFLGIEGPVGTPEDEHPKRPVEGFECSRVEGSGKRLWGWVEERFGTPEKWAERFFVWNYCPLLFLHEGGRNITPTKLRKAQREAIHEPCDEALRKMVTLLKPQAVVGVGAYAERRIDAALDDDDLITGRIMHPSPANPRANAGWVEAIEKEFSELGIEV